MKNKTRLAIVVSHPIQYFVPLYQAISERNELTLKVFFCSRIGLDAYYDKDMDTTISWANDMTSGFDHEFLPESDIIKETNFWTVNNPSIASRLAAFKPDVVVNNGYSQLTQLRTLFWARRNRVPALMFSDSNAVTKRSLLKRVMRQLILRPLFAQYSGFLTCGDQNEELLASFGVLREKMFRSPYPIDETRYRKVRSNRDSIRAKIRKEYNIPNNAFVGITIGKLIPRKRVQDSITAFAHLQKTLSPERDAHLIICGNGPDKELVVNTVKKTGAPVTLAGFINVDRLPDYYGAADVLVHAAEIEAYGIVCSEAACVGLPLILSDLVGAIGKTGVAIPNRNTLVYKCGDIAALVSALQSLASDNALYCRMSEASVRIYEEWNIEACVAGIWAAVSRVSHSRGLPS